MPAVIRFPKTKPATAGCRSHPTSLEQNFLYYKATLNAHQINESNLLLDGYPAAVANRLIAVILCRVILAFDLLNYF